MKVTIGICIVIIALLTAVYNMLGLYIGNNLSEYRFYVSGAITFLCIAVFLIGLDIYTQELLADEAQTKTCDES